MGSICAKRRRAASATEVALAVAADRGASRSWTCGHRLVRQRLLARLLVRCDHCSQLIVAIVHRWLACAGCSYRIHQRCANGRTLLRRCSARRVSSEPNYTLRICPERGLSAQHFKCAECARFVLPDACGPSRGHLYAESGPVRPPRLCDYTGDYFCTICAWSSDTVIIPARVVRNWDFGKYPVSRAALQYLELMYHLPVLYLEEANKNLFVYVEELARVRKLRHELQQMQRFLLACPDRPQSAHLSVLRGRAHLTASPHLYSMRDLVETRSGRLVKALTRAHRVIRRHIGDNCKICQSMGHICQVCSKSEVLFPFDARVAACSSCGRVMHLECHLVTPAHNEPCPICKREERHRKSAGGATRAAGEGAGNAFGPLSGTVTGCRPKTSVERRRPPGSTHVNRNTGLLKDADAGRAGTGDRSARGFAFLGEAVPLGIVGVDSGEDTATEVDRSFRTAKTSFRNSDDSNVIDASTDEILRKRAEVKASVERWRKLRLGKPAPTASGETYWNLFRQGEQRASNPTRADVMAPNSGAVLAGSWTWESVTRQAHGDDSAARRWGPAPGDDSAARRWGPAPGGARSRRK